MSKRTKKSTVKPGLQLPARTTNPEIQLARSQLTIVERKLKKAAWEVEVLTREKERLVRQLESVLQPNLPIS